MKQCGVTLDDFGARRGARGGRAKIVVNVKNRIQNGAQVFDQNSRQHRGGAGKDAAKGKELAPTGRHEWQFVEVEKKRFAGIVRRIIPHPAVGKGDKRHEERGYPEKDYGPTKVPKTGREPVTQKNRTGIACGTGRSN